MKYTIYAASDHCDEDAFIKEYGEVLACFNLKKATEEDLCFREISYGSYGKFIIELNTLDDLRKLNELVGDIVVRKPTVREYDVIEFPERFKYLESKVLDEIIIYDDYME